MNRQILVLGSAALLAVGCSNDGPLALDGADQVAGQSAAEKLIVAKDKAGGARNPTQGNPRSMGAPTRLETLRLDEPLVSYGLQLTWLEVQDSRCPKGAVCIWEGEVKVLLGAKESEGADLGTAWLTLRHEGDERAQVRFGNRLIQLDGVEPYPAVGVEVPRADYTASIGVSMVLTPRPSQTEATVSGDQAGAGETVKPDPTDATGGIDYKDLAAGLEKNNRKWDEHGIDFYQFRFQRSCYCVADYRREALVRVRDGAIEYAEYTDNGEVVAPEAFDRFLTLEDLFARIAAAIDGQAAKIDVSYDPEYGYPTWVFIDHSLSMADEEQQYEVSGFTPLR
jgi:hypothetical protein